jgi:hypothetical protein
MMKKFIVFTLVIAIICSYVQCSNTCAITCRREARRGHSNLESCLRVRCKQTIADNNVRFETESESSNCNIGREAPWYNQCDQRWGHHKLGSSNTVCKVGCLISAVASGMASLGITIVDVDGVAKQATPRTLNTWLLANNGYSGNLFIWTSVAKFNLQYEGQPTGIDQIKSEICAGKIVILNVLNGGHWVLAKSYNGDTFYINDSGFGKQTAKASEVVRAGIFSF